MNNPKTIISILGAVIIAVILVYGFGVDLIDIVDAPTTEPGEAITATATVVRVVDGDTVDVEIDGQQESVRLIGIDAPEINWPTDTLPGSEPTDECYGFEARSFLQDTLDKREVELVGDASQPTRDDYDRLLAYLILDSKDINKMLLEEGFARELTVGAGYERQEAYRAAEAQAEADARGLWLECEN